MKIIFLDIDGVLNSWQEAYLNSRRFSGRTRIVFRQFGYKVVLPVLRKLMDKKKALWWYYRIFTWKLNLCPIACSNLIKLLEDEPNLRIVVSSTWRLSGSWFVRNALRINGIDPKKVIGMTPSTGMYADGTNATRLSGCPRGNQIQEWLYDHARMPHRHLVMDIVTHIVIVDDNSDMVHLKDFFVKTSMEEGFMFKKMERAKEILQVPYVLGMKYDPENPKT